MIAELAERGSLYDLYRTTQRELGDGPHVQRSLRMGLDLAKALAYLHSRRTPAIHRCGSQHRAPTSGA